MKVRSMVKQHAGVLPLFAFLLGIAVLASYYDIKVVQAGEGPQTIVESVRDADLIIVGRIIGLIDTKPVARTRKHLEAHWIRVERTLKGADEAGQRLRAVPHGLSWVDGESYVLFLKRRGGDLVDAISQQPLEATAERIAEVVLEVEAQGSGVSPKRAVWMTYEGGWGGGVLAELIVTEEGDFEWRRRRDGGPKEAPQYEVLVGRSSVADVGRLIRQIEAAGPGPGADDAGILTVRWLDASGRAQMKAYLLPQKPPSSALLEAAEAFARSTGRPK